MKDAENEKMTKQLAKTKGAKKGRRTTQEISRGRARTSKSTKLIMNMRLVMMLRVRKIRTRSIALAVVTNSPMW